MGLREVKLSAPRSHSQNLRLSPLHPMLRTHSPQALSPLLSDFVTLNGNLKRVGPKVAKTFIFINHSTSGRFGSSVCPVQKMKAIQVFKIVIIS